MHDKFQESEIQYSKWKPLVQGFKIRGCAIAAALLSGFIPESSPGTHKAQASIELNQIRSAKRCPNPPWEARFAHANEIPRRHSQSLFYTVCAKGYKASLSYSEYIRAAEICRRADPRRKERHGGSGEAFNPCTLESGPRYTWAVCIKYIIRTYCLGVARRNETLRII